MPPITPPTIAPVLEVLIQGGGDVDRYMGGISGNEVEVAIRILPGAGATPVGLAEGVLGVPITVPGPISGLSKIHRCEAAE